MSTHYEVREGQVYDDLFGRYMWTVVFVTSKNALLLSRGSEDEMLVSLDAFRKGGGWRLYS